MRSGTRGTRAKFSGAGKRDEEQRPKEKTRPNLKLLQSDEVKEAFNIAVQEETGKIGKSLITECKV